MEELILIAERIALSARKSQKTCKQMLELLDEQEKLAVERHTKLMETVNEIHAMIEDMKWGT